MKIVDIKIKFVPVLALLVAMTIDASAQNNQGMFAGSTDIGTIKISGTLKYDPNTGSYTVGGSGQNVWGRQRRL
ncbi:MAG: hypothetical protein O2887_02845 [Bacteroidetes bacterium]|nr:hypothetical protein [Bacteroidota bacterium]MDA1119428.1 hypothetical protein [Bacteroidota bacterium]